MELPTHDRIIIFPDIHGRKFWKDVDIKDYDKAIFLGDYLDPYPQEEITDDMALANFKEIIKLNNRNPNKIVFLLGNHDLHYMFDNFVISTRYSKRTRRLIHSCSAPIKICSILPINAVRTARNISSPMQDWS